MEIDKLRRQLEVREDYFVKYRDTKNQLRELQEAHKKKEISRKEQIELITEQKKKILKLKKKVKLLKEKVPQEDESIQKKSVKN